MRNTTIKSVLAALATACAFAAPAAAAERDGPRFEPGPVVELDASSVALAGILLNQQLKDCVADWQAQGASIQGVTSQGLQPGVTQYVVSGLKLLGGDIVSGHAAMTILETMTPATFGFGQVPVYTCQVVASDIE
jgi:hypothetical protein